MSYSLLKVEDGEPTAHSPEDDYENVEKRIHKSQLVHGLIGILLIIGSFLAGSFLQPIEWPTQHAVSNALHNGYDSTERLVPECKVK